MRVTGTLQGAPFQGSTMLVAGGRFLERPSRRARDEREGERDRCFCVGVSRAALKAADASVGDEVELSLERAT
jgi:hypothetical protein